MSNVLELIEEAAKTKQTELNLSSNELTELPPEITKLTNLTTLDLSYNQLTELPPEITKLTNLTTLDLSHNQQIELSPDITKLTNLTTLKLNDNQLMELLPDIAKLTKLSTLLLSGNELIQLPPEIINLKNLTKLYLWENFLEELPPEIMKLTNLTTLDLSYNQLTKLPPDIAKLTNLTTLELSYNRLRKLPPDISKLTNLTTLDLSGNELTELPLEITKLIKLTTLDLSGNELTELPPEISKLTNLTKLYLVSNGLTELPLEITKLINLITLYLTSNELTELPSDITNLKNITVLHLDSNQLTDFPHEITKLINLKRLDLTDNQLTKLPSDISNLKNITDLFLNDNLLTEFPHEITKLINLINLDISDNGLAELPPEIINLINLEILPLSNNPLKSPPIEIAEKGIGAITDYFKSLEESERQPLNEVKVLLVGHGGAGKTSLVKRLLGDKFDNNEPQTHGININKWEIIDGDDKIKVHFWDFGGQEIMHATHKFFLSKRSLYVLVLDGRKEEDEEYWLKHIESFGGDSPILVVINKIDDNPSSDVNRTLLHTKYKGIKSFHRISCKENEGIDSFAEILNNELLKVELRHEQFAKNWFNVKTKLENMTDNFISYEEYQKLCIEEHITSESAQETLIGFLSNLGIILYFKEFHLNHTHVLEPKWITGAVYKIINSKKVAQNKGLLRLDSLSDILKQEIEADYLYPRDKHEYIIDMMKKFELCYEIESGCILIPDLLEIQEPEFDFDYASSLKFRIDYDFLPNSVMSSFIVKMHKDIKDNLRWKTGVVLEDVTFNSKAVIKADESDKKIYIFVDGKQKREYFSVILYIFREINNSFKKMKATEKVPLPDKPEITVSYEHLIRLEGKGVKMYFPDGSENEYDVKKLLGAVFVENKTEDEILRILKKLVDKNDTEESLLEKANSIVKLQPGAFGISVDVNEVVKRVIKWNK